MQGLLYKLQTSFLVNESDRGVKSDYGIKANIKSSSIRPFKEDFYGALKRHEGLSDSERYKNPSKHFTGHHAGDRHSHFETYIKGKQVVNSLKTTSDVNGCKKSLGTERSTQGTAHSVEGVSKLDKCAPQTLKSDGSIEVLDEMEVKVEDALTVEDGLNIEMQVKMDQDAATDVIIDDTSIISREMELETEDNLFAGSVEHSILPQQVVGVSQSVIGKTEIKVSVVSQESEMRTVRDGRIPLDHLDVDGRMPHETLQQFINEEKSDNAGPKALENFSTKGEKISLEAEGNALNKENVPVFGENLQLDKGSDGLLDDLHIKQSFVGIKPALDRVNSKGMMDSTRQVPVEPFEKGVKVGSSYRAQIGRIMDEDTGEGNAAKERKYSLHSENEEPTVAIVQKTVSQKYLEAQQNYVSPARNVIEMIAQQLDEIKRAKRNSVLVQIDLENGERLQCRFMFKNNNLDIRFPHVDADFKHQILQHWQELKQAANARQLTLSQPEFLTAEDHLLTA